MHTSKTENTCLPKSSCTRLDNKKTSIGIEAVSSFQAIII